MEKHFLCEIVHWPHLVSYLYECLGPEHVNSPKRLLIKLSKRTIYEILRVKTGVTFELVQRLQQSSVFLHISSGRYEISSCTRI